MSSRASVTKSGVSPSKGCLLFWAGACEIQLHCPVGPMGGAGVELGLPAQACSQGAPGPSVPVSPCLSVTHRGPPEQRVSAPDSG